MASKKADPTDTSDGRVVRVGLYTRISTDEDHQPYSLEAQADRLDAYVRSQGNWTDARKGRFDLLLVFCVDRLARSIRSLALILDELDQAGVSFRSATEPFDTSAPAGRMMVQMLGVFAEFERATLIERVVAGMEKKAARGGWNGGTRPFGYDYDKARGCLVMNETEAPIVRKIFELYVSGLWGSASISQWLNDKGYRTKRGAFWSPNTVRNLLVNRAYVGQVFFRDTCSPGMHKPIVEANEFERAQRLLAERGEDASRRRGNASEFVLSGTIVCERCGRRFVGVAHSPRQGQRRCASASTSPWGRRRATHKRSPGCVTRPPKRGRGRRRSRFACSSAYST